MTRFRSGHTSLRKQVRQASRFIQNRGALLALLFLMLVGVVFGIRSFGVLNEEHRILLENYLYKSIDTNTTASVMHTIIGSFMRHMSIVIVLFFLGLTAFGCPLIFATTIAFGFRIGIILSTAYMSNGFGYTALIVYPPLMLVGTASLLTIRRSLHMSCVFSYQLLPDGAHCGGLWNEFKRYLFGYMISLGLIFLASLSEALLHVIKSML